MTIKDILSIAEEGKGLDRDQILTLMKTEGKDIDLLFESAGAVRDKVFGNRISIYGFVYFSTYCKNQCAFCYYRGTNSALPRYRKSTEEVVELSCDLVDAGVNLVDLTMGEDPVLYANGYKGVLDTVQAIRDSVDVAIMASPGALDEETFPKLRSAGADWFACYQETHNRELFKKLRLDQDYDRRLNQKIWANNAGILTEEGILVGIGETAEDRTDSIMAMGPLGCQQVRAMTFVPQNGTPMEQRDPSNSIDERKVIALLRLAYPDRFIPASLDVEGIDGLVTRVNAGANIITSIVPPHEDLAGVAQHDLDIDNGNRSVQHVMEMLDDMGRRVTTNNEYLSLINKWR